MVRCAFDTLQDPELAFGVVREVAGAIGMNNAALLDKIHGALRSLAPTVARIASGLAIGSTLTNLWDGISDNLANGRINVRLTGSTPPPEAELPTNERCRRSPQEVVICFYNAWKVGNRAAAEQLATPAMVDWIFQFQWAIEWQFGQCAGSTCSCVEPDPGGEHGFRMEFTMEEASDGSRVSSVETFG